MLQPDGRILIGGAFTNVGGQARSYIARLNSNGSVDTDFDPNANGRVNAIALQADGKILVGSAFTIIGGQSRNRIARLDSSGSPDSFNPNGNNEVNALAVQPDGKVLIGGQFTIVGGRTRNRVARLSNDTASANSFDIHPWGIILRRTGAAPVFHLASFEVSVGATTTNLGNAFISTAPGGVIYSATGTLPSN